jgi:hypothetical protein
MRIQTFGGRVANASLKTVPPGACQYLCRGCSGDSDPAYLNKYCMTEGAGCKDKDMLDDVIQRAREVQTYQASAKLMTTGNF